MLRLKTIVVQLNNCEVKKLRNSEKLDVVLKSCTEISESDVAIDVESIDDDGDVGDDVTLSQIDDLENFKQVNLRCKVICVKPVVEVSSGNQKLSLEIRLGQGWSRYSRKILAEEISYQLRSFVVQEHASKE